MTPTLLIYSHERKFEIIIGTNHMIQNCKAEFVIKDQQVPYFNIIINIISYQYYHQHHKQSHSTYIHINSCLRFTFPRSLDNTNLIQQQSIISRDWYFKENSKLNKKTMVFKTNSYAHLKFNKEVNRRTNIKFWAESPL